jgi:hypothetical protein
VLGIDVGFSERRRTTCFCLFRWEPTAAFLTFRRTTADADKRRAALISLLGADRKVEAVAVDGPLGPGLCRLTHYRSAEALLSQGKMQKRGKPGQTSSPTGQLLHHHATVLATLALEVADVAPASHVDPIHDRRIVEAFPNAFLAALLDNSAFTELERNASDVFWRDLSGSGALVRLCDRLLPGREIKPRLDLVADHDERAGTVCALTAMAVVRGSYVAIGDPLCGDIILPPTSAWGKGATKEPWLRQALEMATVRLRTNPGHRYGFEKTRVHFCEGDTELNRA